MFCEVSENKVISHFKWWLCISDDTMWLTSWITEDKRKIKKWWAETQLQMTYTLRGNQLLIKSISHQSRGWLNNHIGFMLIMMISVPFSRLLGHWLWLNQFSFSNCWSLISTIYIMLLSQGYFHKWNFCRLNNIKIEIST